MKERQKEYSLRCNLKSISSTAEAGKVHLQCCPPPLPLEKGKDGSWWLLSLRERFLPYLRAYNYKNRFTTLSVEEKPDMPTSGESGSPNPRACETARKNWWAIVMGDSLLQGKRGTQMLAWPVDWRSLLPAGGPHPGYCGGFTVADPTLATATYSYSTWEQIIRLGETCTVPKLTIEVWGQ